MFKIEDNCLLVKRHVRGFSLSTQGNSKKERINALGTMSPVSVKMNVDLKNQYAEWNFDELECDDGMLIIPLEKAVNGETT